MPCPAGQQGRTVLYVSHNMNTIRQLCAKSQPDLVAC